MPTTRRDGAGTTGTRTATFIPDGAPFYSNKICLPIWAAIDLITHWWRRSS